MAKASIEKRIRITKAGISRTTGSKQRRLQNKLLKKYKRSEYFRKALNTIKANPKISQMSLGIELGKLFDVKYNWQWDFVDKMLNEIKECINNE